jgi:hypothetical protein
MPETPSKNFLQIEP